NHVARVGLNYKFDPTGAVYAPAADARAPLLLKAPKLAAWTWSGLYVGGTIGYGAGKSNTDTAFSDPVSGAELFATSRARRLDGVATLRGRLGVVATPDAIAYVTGGLAVGEVMTAGTVLGFDGNGNPVNTIVSSHNTKAGLAVGGGIEGRLAGNWTAKIEYLYLDLGTVTVIPAPALNSTTAVAFNSRITDNILRVGINYKFDPYDISGE